MGDLREQLERIEYRITQGMTAAQVFTQMKQLLTADDGRTARGAVPEGLSVAIFNAANAFENPRVPFAPSSHAAHRRQLKLLRDFAGSITAAPQPAGEDETQADRTDREMGQLIDERDRVEAVLDKVLDLVLGPERDEWSSAYGFADAVIDVEERMAELADKSAAPPDPAPSAPAPGDALSLDGAAGRSASRAPADET